ncbi:hypothetical protein [Nocardia sp. BMG51109]|uniref:hypothetical protein n=1 Tax=Nocardia sp. BMG51109 TaxID=1056816 RepID=UPI00056995AB
MTTAALAAGLVILSAGGAHAESRATLGGGSGIVVDGDSLCSLTTIGWDARDRLVGFTAAHCGRAGSRVAGEAHRDAGVVGTFSHVDELLDYAVIEFDPNSVVPVNNVAETTISGIGGPARFPAVGCKQGRTTGRTCGLVYGDVSGTQTWTATQICVVSGDSGGPIAVGTTLVGMVNAYIQIPCLGPQIGVNFTTILAAIDGRGGVGSGFHPV